MATKICPECKNAIDENAPYCPFCGHEFTLSEKPGENEPSERTKRKRRKNVSVVANDETIVEHVPVETVAKEEKKEPRKEPAPKPKEVKPVPEIKKSKPEVKRPDKVITPEKTVQREEDHKAEEDLGRKIMEEAKRPNASDAENLSEKNTSETLGRDPQVKEETDEKSDKTKASEKKSSRRKKKDEADNPAEEKAPVVEYDANWDGYYDDVKAEYEEMKAQYNADNLVKVIWTVVLMVAAFVVYFIFAFK